MTNRLTLEFEYAGPFVTWPPMLDAQKSSGVVRVGGVPRNSSSSASMQKNHLEERCPPDPHWVIAVQLKYVGLIELREFSEGT